ncbi:MAG: AAA family ATPase [Elusimicrobiota bacterium]
MKLISKVEIDHFRSIRNETIDGLGDFTAFAGLNNSGKSNVLRALNAFFRDQTDSGLRVDFAQDYYRHDLKTKKSKLFSITVKFDLPASFKFRRGLEPIEKLLGRSFTIRKLWMRNRPEPHYYLNNFENPLSLELRAQIEQFLALISFRYIPNRVLPLDIIRSEHKALRDVLVRRLAKEAKKQESVFAAIGKTSETLIKSLQSAVHEACPDVGSIRLATPLAWQDLIFAFGYKLRTNDSELDDTAQGSGIQSLLMLETLSLIDRDYFQKFGWRQAAIWAVEEPESSLHTSLEAKVASYLAKIASAEDNRLQVFCTTHSDLMLQNADQNYFVTMSKGSSALEACD